MKTPDVEDDEPSLAPPAAEPARSESKDVRRLQAEVADLRAELDETHRGVVILHAQLAQAERGRNSFLAMLAHELRNPLAVAALALEEPGGAQRDVVSRQLQQLTRLVDDLLEASRVVRGKISLHPEPLDLAALVADVVDERQPLFAREGRTLHWDAPAAPCGVSGDAARLRQIVTNLLDNAQKYSPEGTDAYVALAVVKEDVRLTVRDEGRGLSPDEMAEIFELFVQAERGLAREPGGLGIGLTLVRQLAEAHGGEVAVQSDGPGKGSTFIVQLPHVTLEPAASTPPPASEPAPELSLRGRRLLLVEDGDELRILLSARLRHLGLEVVAVEDAATALQTLEMEAPFELVLADVGLPRMDGYELARRITASRPELPLVAMTGYGSSDHRARAATAGFAAHLVKPVAFDELIQTLQRLLSDSEP